MENLKKDGIKYLLNKLKTWIEETFVAITDAVFSVNGNAPDENGNVTLERVDMAGNLETTFKQNSTGTFLQRTSGGSAAIINGESRLVSVMGNIEHENYAAPIVAMEVTPASEDDPISATIDQDAFIASLEDKDSPITITLTYATATGWSSDPAEIGITIIGTETNDDQIVVDYTPEVRGTIYTTAPSNFISTGWNLYDPVNEYAKVVKYSDEYGYRISGTYTSLAFATSPSGTTTTITPVNGLFSIPSDGYVIVSGGNSEDTAIYPTWSDWVNGYPGAFETFTTSVISLSSVIANYFPYGLCAVGSVKDEINLSNGRAIRRIDRIEYSEANLASAKASGRGYVYDADFIYIVLASPINSVISVSGVFDASDHGIEYFTDTLIPAQAQATYSMNLKNKLERDTVTISQQSLSSADQAQVRKNIGASSNDDITNAVSTLNGSIIVRTYSYKYTTAIASNAQKSFTAANFGIAEIEGYKIVHINVRSTGHKYLHAYAVYPVSSGTVLSLRNNYSSSASATGGITISIDVMYVKSQLVGA